ncbi:hypothetical protein ABW19_dt0203234 [Dactylella cylindrospora]|nr:hypothetical protein ABW19_dt0203234 [Dactylella cylindrospora]
MSSFFRRYKNKSPAVESRAGPAETNPFKSVTPQVNGPPPYTPIGAAASYYGNAPQPQYPPVPVHPGQNGPMPPQMPMNAGPPNPLINPNTLPLPSANPTPGADDPYSFLRSFDTVILVDDSGSMAGGRWRQCAEALATVVPIVTYYDSDGIDLYFLNHPDSPYHHNIKTPAQVMEIFSNVNPSRATPTGTALNRLLKPYLQKFKANPNRTKPMNIIVITDGVPTDDVESVIIQAARKLDDMDADLTQVGIQFFQIGSEAEATEALRELDDALSSRDNIRDMVDTVPYRGTLQGDQMLKVVLGAVNKRLDRKKA